VFCVSEKEREEAEEVGKRMRKRYSVWDTEG